MKKHLLLLLLLCSLNMNGQTSEMYVYLCQYEVQTATGEKTKREKSEYFNCKFNSDKSICYETDFQGNPGKYDSQIFHYIKTENGIRVYEARYNNNTSTKHLYFSPDYSKMNYPGGYHQVLIYDRVYPDKNGSPTKMW